MHRKKWCARQLRCIAFISQKMSPQKDVGTAFSCKMFWNAFPFLHKMLHEKALSHNLMGA